MSSPSSLDDVSNNSLRLPLWDKASAEFYFAKSRELLTRPFPSARRVPHGSCRNICCTPEDNRAQRQTNFVENQFQNLSFEDNYYRPNASYRDRTLTKSESMVRKTYSSDPRLRYDQSNRFFNTNIPDSVSFNANGSQYLETSYVYYKTDLLDDNYANGLAKAKELFGRPRTLSFSDYPDAMPKRNGRSIRDRNRRRQSYNPRAYESSSSDSDCVSAGSVDFDWRRRRRLSRLSTSNTSIRSEMIKRSTNPFLKPQCSVKMMGRSPPPSSSVLSGLSPTSAARCQRSSQSTSSDSSL